MWRKMACAAAGLALAAAAVHVLTPTLSGASPRQSVAIAKSDRLPVPAKVPVSGFAISFNLPEIATTVVAKNPPKPPVVSSIRFPRPEPVQAVNPIDLPVAQKPRMPEGCEPSFSAVTVPSLAYVASRCTS